MASRCGQSRGLHGSLGGKGVRRGDRQVEFLFQISASAADEATLTCSAGVYGLSSQSLISHRKSQQVLTSSRYLLPHLSPPIGEHTRSL